MRLLICVHDHQQVILFIGSDAFITKYAIVLAVQLGPFESCFFKVALMQWQLFRIQGIQPGHHVFQFPVSFIIQRCPAQLCVVVPFFPLCKFTTHEDELVAGMGVHVGKQQTIVGKLMPLIAAHFVPQ